MGFVNEVCRLSHGRGPFLCMLNVGEGKKGNEKAGLLGLVVDLKHGILLYSL